jgi:TetR/AcrR family transcriptional regulator, transcriptional repressor for nem operon
MSGWPRSGGTLRSPPGRCSHARRYRLDGKAAAVGASGTRELIVRAADRLFYERGFEHTSFSDIADAVRISRGNFYYHFKSKDEILNAVIEERIEDRQKLIQEWESREASPAGRIRSYVNIVVDNQPDIERFGCPVGTLTTELAKLGHDSQPGATEIMNLFRVWLRKQFEAMGRHEDADFLAMHVLARSQGIATLSNAYRDRAFVAREVELLCDWVGAQMA